jgi:hypothetical protein
MDKLDSIGEEFPEIFNFTFGHWESMGELVWDGKQLVHRVTVLRKHGTPLSISNESWKSFWSAVEKANVWNWAAEYMNDMVLDGTQWSLEIKYGGKYIRCEGSNAFPGHDDGPAFDPECEFGKFYNAVEKLMGRQFQPSNYT